jgi:hypothetical protein
MPENESTRTVKESVRMAIISTLIAAVTPATVGIWSTINKSKEVDLANIAKERETDLAAKDQTFKMQMAALDRAIDPHRPAEDRRQVLRFLAAVASDDRLQGWAKDELKVVQDELDTYKRELTDTKEKFNAEKREDDSLRKALAEKGHTAVENFHLRERLKATEAEEAETNRKYVDLLLKDSPQPSSTSPLFTTPSIGRGTDLFGSTYVDSGGLIRLSATSTPSFLSHVAPSVTGIDGLAITPSYVPSGSFSVTAPSVK